MTASTRQPPWNVTNGRQKQWHKILQVQFMIHTKAPSIQISETKYRKLKVGNSDLSLSDTQTTEGVLAAANLFAIPNNSHSRPGGRRLDWKSKPHCAGIPLKNQQ
jgi:hypothetical protein